MIDFENKKILITGATGGIGGALIKKFTSLNGSILATGTKSEKLELIKQKYKDSKIKGDEKAEIAFALGKASEDVKDFKNAFK